MPVKVQIENAPNSMYEAAVVRPSSPHMRRFVAFANRHEYSLSTRWWEPRQHGKYATGHCEAEDEGEEEEEEEQEEHTEGGFGKDSSNLEFEPPSSLSALTLWPRTWRARRLPRRAQLMAQWQPPCAAAVRSPARSG